MYNDPEDEDDVYDVDAENFHLDDDEEADSDDSTGKRKDRDLLRISETSELIPSDRASLLSEANRLVETLIQRESVSMLSGFHVDTTPTREEASAYNAALSYLQRQFEIGHSDSETYTKTTEREEEYEIERE